MSSKLQSLIYLSMHIINKDDKLKQGLPEIVYTLDEKSFIRFLKVCGGQTIRVPTLNEVALALITAVCTYKVIKEHLTLDNIFDTYKLPKSYMDYIRDKHKQFMDSLTDDELKFIESI